MIAPKQHEYVVIGGLDRVKVGRWLSIAASGLSGALVFFILYMENLATKFNVHVNLPPVVLSLVSAGVVFGVLYTALNKWIWKWGKIAGALKVANISGAWHCVGKTIGPTGAVNFEWEGTVTIVQSWNYLQVRFSGSKSKSYSISAALSYDEAEGFVLLYHYKNDPKMGQVELSGHAGCAVLTFNKELNSAEGDYFNGRGRNTFGTMYWTKENR